jgi:hypothetical protein
LVALEGPQRPSGRLLCFVWAQALDSHRATIWFSTQSAVQSVLTELYIFCLNECYHNGYASVANAFNKSALQHYGIYFYHSQCLSSFLLQSTIRIVWASHQAKASEHK